MAKITVRDFDGKRLTTVEIDPYGPATDVSDAILYALYEVPGMDESTASELADIHTLANLR